MKLGGWTIAALSGLLLGSARPPAAAPPLLPVDPAALEDEGCPGGAGESCILLSSDGGEMVLAGLPEPIGAPAPAARPAPPPAPPIVRVSAVRVVISLPQ